MGVFKISSDELMIGPEHPFPHTTLTNVDKLILTPHFARLELEGMEKLKGNL